MARQFASAAAFKASLEAHLRKRASEQKVPLNTLQLKFVIERFLARLFRDPACPWLLKGGFAMDLRFRPHARTTKDVDLSMAVVSVEAEGGPVAALRELLQDAVDCDLGDHLGFRIGEPKKELTNAPGGGARFPCEAVLVGKVYAKFHLDVGCGDAVVGEPERLVGDDVLSFAGVGPATVLAITKAQQFAEKVHAYTFPWSGRQNTRTKDLVDLVLLVERGALVPDNVQGALLATFSTRGSHPLPRKLPPPPEGWTEDFAPMAAEAGLATTNYLEAFSVLERFWEAHVLGGTASG